MIKIMKLRLRKLDNYQCICLRVVNGYTYELKMNSLLMIRFLKSVCIIKNYYCLYLVGDLS